MDTIQPTAGCSYVARVAFDVGPKTFKPGDPVRCADVGVHEAVMFGWWQAGMIAVAPTAAVAQPKVGQPPQHKHQQRR